MSVNVIMCGCVRGRKRIQRSSGAVYLTTTITTITTTTAAAFINITINSSSTTSSSSLTENLFKRIPLTLYLRIDDNSNQYLGVRVNIALHSYPNILRLK
ncbi:Hypothetical predicted protein [Octopus vulgaris]|uniref:Uncharacterized protein n=1 Tax=Octopus vulgaris TaxID=6645 RepID=A0AA36BJ51_OCTVU|nr:Hypothetical predicted protein [Octopus vulgaris]